MHLKPRNVDKILRNYILFHLETEGQRYALVTFVNRQLEEAAHAQLCHVVTGPGGNDRSMFCIYSCLNKSNVYKYHISG